MKTSVCLFTLCVLSPLPALAHPGAPLHSHDVAGWTGPVLALGLIAVVAALVVRQVRA